ncbi:unnamed protein product, partial [Symbiodinium pilosum]
NRHEIDGYYHGKILFYRKDDGYGFVAPGNVEQLPTAVQARVRMNKSGLYFRTTDLSSQFTPVRGQCVTFQVYTDKCGAGAYNLCLEWW